MELIPVFFILFLFAIPSLVALTDFVSFLFRGRFYTHIISRGIFSFIALIGYPLFYIGMADTNDCCNDTAAFAQEHVLSVLMLIACYVASYFYCLRREQIYSPLVELCANAFIIAGLVFNVLVAIHTKSMLYWGLGNTPGILFLLNMLLGNHVFLMREINPAEIVPRNVFEKIAVKILYLPVFVKFPLFMVLCLPLLALLVAFLLLFGQKPNSLIQAFTQTYKHGFSELDYMCDNVQCGGHYLCSVAANGHTAVVKPQRLGMRHGNYIICNRQLLISNAFEELVAEKLPFAHKVIRKNYDKVGDVIHKYYGVFNNKFVADAVYVLMKPAEWLFLLVLYTFDKKPENRIAKQYLSVEDRAKIKATN
ncbi:MAG: DUF6688 family protein [Bacteroidota bacterium]